MKKPSLNILTKLFTVAGLMLVVTAFISQAQSESRRNVIELFTSQGCSSCPPADALLKEYVKRDDVIALSYGVDYWDYLGWKDTLASAENTKRQQAYAVHAGRANVFTPEMVIDGEFSVVGSDGRAVTEALRKSVNRSQSAIDVEIAQMHGKVVVRLDGPMNSGEAVIWLVRYDRETEVDIKRGENRGRKITYHNVVRDIHAIGMWRGEAIEIALMQEDLVKGGRDGCAILVQRDRSGPILGAAEMKF